MRRSRLGRPDGARRRLRHRLPPAPLRRRRRRSVIGVEPHPSLVAIARRRTRRLPHVDGPRGAAEALPLPDASVDVVHARWAYFFGPGCEPGLAELDRVVRRGGTAFVIDNDPTRSTFGGWFRRGFPEVDPVAVERFWSSRGWARHPLDIRWEFASRADLEAVVRIELPTARRRGGPRVVRRHRRSTTPSTCGRGGTEPPGLAAGVRPP